MATIAAVSTRTTASKPRRWPKFRKMLVVYGGLTFYAILAGLPIYWMVITTFKPDRDLYNLQNFPLWFNANGITFDNWMELMKQFVAGPFLAIKNVLPHMIEARYGSIVNIGSVVSRVPIAGQCGYPTAKAAVEGLTRAVAADAGPYNVRSNCIVVGAVPTVDDDFDDVAQAAYMNSMHRGFLDPTTDLGASGPSMQLLGRFGVAADIAALAAFLASRESAFLTATSIPADGGLSAKWPVPLAEQLATTDTTGGA